MEYAYSFDEEQFDGRSPSIVDAMDAAVGEALDDVENYIGEATFHRTIYIGQLKDARPVLRAKADHLLSDIEEQINAIYLDEFCFDDPCYRVNKVGRSECAQELIALLEKHGHFHFYAVENVGEFQVQIDVQADGLADDYRWVARNAKGLPEETPDKLHAEVAAINRFRAEWPADSLLLDLRDGNVIATNGPTTGYGATVAEAVQQLLQAMI